MSCKVEVCQACCLYSLGVVWTKGVIMGGLIGSGAPVSESITSEDLGEGFRGGVNAYVEYAALVCLEAFDDS